MYYAQDMGKFLVFKIGVLFTTLFLFFTTTTLVSFTLRETQVLHNHFAIGTRTGCIVLQSRCLQTAGRP